jgi:hypothetical protein
VAQTLIDDAAIEIHLARVLGLERPAFEVHDHEAAEAQVVKEEVEIEVVAANVKMILASNEGEALAEFEDEFFDFGQQGEFEFALAERFCEGEEVEDVRVFENLLGKVGLRWREGAMEIVDGFAGASMGLALDLERENVA